MHDPLELCYREKGTYVPGNPLHNSPIVLITVSSCLSMKDNLDFLVDQIVIAVDFHFFTTLIRFL